MNKNKKLFLIAPLVLIGFNELATVDAQVPCTVVEVPPDCLSAPRISINVDSKNISPRNICGSPGQSIPVSFRPENTENTVRIEPKTDNDWLRGEGSRFSIDIPASANGEFEYNVYFEDGSCIDPRISVD